jgi:hypothetical protein
MSMRWHDIALTFVAILVAALAWRFSPDLAIGDDLGEFGLLAGLGGVFAALTIAANLEDRLH